MVFFFLVRVQRSRHLFMHVRVMQWQSSQMRRYPFSMLQYICTTRPRLAKLMKSLAPSMNLSVLFFFSSFGEVAFFSVCFWHVVWFWQLFSIKMMEGIVATSYAAGDKFYIDPAKLLPLSRFLTQPKYVLILAHFLLWKLHILVVRLTADDYGVFHSLDLLVIKKKKKKNFV